MIKSFKPINGPLTQATPPGYEITNIKKIEGSWTYETREFTDSIEYDNYTNIDFKYIHGENPTVTNKFNSFINKRSASVRVNGGIISNAISIDSIWDNEFPETIKLRYPGYSGSSTGIVLTQLDNEINYDFKIWPNNTNQSTVTVSNPYDINTFRKMAPEEYFHDLLNYLNINKSLSYEEWLSMPSFSLKNLLGKSIQHNGVLYQLYKIDDVNVQSLSVNFDEYIPWCFDQNGIKIEQHKIALITSFNRKEIYLLLEIRPSDIYYTNDERKEDTEIRTISNILFWRSGINDTTLENKSRSFDQEMLLRKKRTGETAIKVSNISDYFRDQEVVSDVLKGFQHDRFEDDQISGVGGDRENDNDFIEIISNVSSEFETLEYNGTVPDFLAGFKNLETDRIDITSEYKFNNRNKNMFNVFVGGKLQNPNDINIVNERNRTYLEIPVVQEIMEIFVNSFNTPNLFFNLSTKQSIDKINTSNVQKTLYDNGLLWKLDGEEEYVIFDDGSYKGETTSGKMLIVHGINFRTDEVDLPIGPGLDLASDTYQSKGLIDDISIIYDPMNIEVKYKEENYPNDQIQNVESSDIWIFDNTLDDIKTNENEPYLKYRENKVEFMETVDPTMELQTNKYIKPLTEAISEKGVVDYTLTQANQNVYVKKHYEQMSTINRNIFNMFIMSEYPTANSSWLKLTKNSKLNLKKDFAIVRYKSEDKTKFPLLTVDVTYKFENKQNNVSVRVEPIQNGDYLYYILNRQSKELIDIKDYSFSEEVQYIII